MSVAESFVAAVTDGPMLLAAPVAAAAGLVSFLSPCCLPLVPGYLSFVTGLSGADLTARGMVQQSSAGPPALVGVTTVQEGQTVRPAKSSHSSTPGSPATVPARAAEGRGRVLLGSLLFVLGFSAVFVTEGALFGGLGSVLLVHQRTVQIVLGAVTVLMGLMFAGVLTGFNRDLRVHWVPKAGLAGAPLLGVVFGVGWTPCLGPTLGAVQTLAYTQGSAGRGALLTLFYCLGLGLPFIASGLAFQRALAVFARIRRHTQTITRIGGGLLITVGLLLMTGLWDQLTIWLRVWVSGYSTSV